MAPTSHVGIAEGLVWASSGARLPTNVMITTRLLGNGREGRGKPSLGLNPPPQSLPDRSGPGEPFRPPGSGRYSPHAQIIIPALFRCFGDWSCGMTDG